MLGRIRDVVNGALRPLGVSVERIPDPSAALQGITFHPLHEEGLSEVDRDTRRLKNVLAYTKSSGTPYNGIACDSGYHSIEINGQLLRGQRNTRERFEAVPYDFSGKTVLDLGCNQGGMLFSISDQLLWGVGVDVDRRVVNAANRIKASRDAQNLHFYVFDLEKEPLDFLENLLHQSQVDIVFLLSVCLWIDNWQDVIAHASRLAPAMLFESNGTPEQQAEQEAQLRLHYREVQQLLNETRDDPLQSRRKLFLCRR